MNITWKKLLLHIIIFMVAIILLILHSLHFTPIMVDDAYISFRYIQNLVQGNGLTFNPGEKVEGTSAPLFCLLCALLHFPFRDHASQLIDLSRMIGMLSAIGCAILIYIWALKMVKNKKSSQLWFIQYPRRSHSTMT